MAGPTAIADTLRAAEGGDATPSVEGETTVSDVVAGGASAGSDANVRAPAVATGAAAGNRAPDNNDQRRESGLDVDGFCDENVMGRGVVGDSAS